MSTVFANGFDYGTDEEAVKKHFGVVGAIKELHFQSRGAAVITYVKSSSATRAVDELHETTMEGQSRYVVVKLDDPDREVKGGKGKGKGKDTNGKGKGKTNGYGKGGGGGSGRSIFVTGFEFETDDNALEKHFASMGAIEDYHFQSKRSAVITYVKASAAQQAVTKLDGSTMRGQSRYVAVKLDDPDRDDTEWSEWSRPAKGSGKKGSSKAVGKDSGRSVYCSGFDFDTDEEALTYHFSDVGAIESCYFQSKGAAVVTYVKGASAHRAVTELGGTTMDGQSRYVAVKLDNAVHKGPQAAGGKGKGKWKSRE